MPTIAEINFFKILIYYDDHLPPHFHAQYTEFEELMEINTRKTYSGYLPTRQIKKVVKWAALNQKNFDGEME